MALIVWLSRGKLSLTAPIRAVWLSAESLDLFHSRWIGCVRAPVVDIQSIGATSPPQVEALSHPNFAIEKLPGAAAELPVAEVSPFGSPPLQHLRDLLHPDLSSDFFSALPFVAFVDDSVSQDLSLWLSQEPLDDISEPASQSIPPVSRRISRNICQSSPFGIQLRR